MRIRRILALLMSLMLLLTAAGAAAESVTPNSELPIPKFLKNVAVHDPSIIKADDGYYYIYGSHMAAARSLDLIDWEMISKGPSNMQCTLFKNVQSELKEALNYARTNTFWASDVIQLADGKYYLYYCTCQGSSPLSMLGYAVSDRPEGPYTNLGIIRKSGYAGYNAGSLPNAIDPCVFFDKEGRLWMVYGSYSGGIFILEMDPATGLPLETDGNKMNQGYGKKLLGGNHSQIEAPYILYSPDTDYYYLFLSFGGLNANDGYNMRVCRSKTPDGPYEGMNGQKMIRAQSYGGISSYRGYEEYGVKIMGGYEFLAIDGDKNKITQAYRSPGHNSAYYDEETGRYFLVFHTRFANMGESFQVRVHQMYFNQEGWPVVSPLRYAGEMPEAPAADAITGVYKIILHGRDINRVEHESQVVALHEDGTVSGDLNGTWSTEDGVNITMVLDDITYCGVLHTALDAGQKNWTTCISATDTQGASMWAYRALKQE